jgi:DNA polymerase-3 subunit delta'
MFAHITGNDHVKAYLKNMIDKQAIGNSLLFSGPENAQMHLFAEALAKYLLGGEIAHHPDYHVYRPEGKIGMHSIHSMRKFSEEVYIAPFQAKWKVFVIYDADRMLSYSANALLKTFEEPAKDSFIILVTHSPQLLLPTVLSRCRAVRFHGEIEEKRANNELLLGYLSRGKFATYTELMEAAKQLSEVVETARKEEEAVLREDMERIGYKDLNAVQKEALEKELEGALAMRLAQQAESLFGDVLAWFRDLELLQVGGRRELLMHAHVQGEGLPLESVQKAIREATLSLERSTSLTMVLERLFLQLNFL